jgi:hypothetical protein
MNIIKFANTLIIPVNELESILAYLENSLISLGFNSDIIRTTYILFLI